MRYRLLSNRGLIYLLTDKASNKIESTQIDLKNSSYTIYDMISDSKAQALIQAGVNEYSINNNKGNFSLYSEKKYKVNRHFEECIPSIIKCLNCKYSECRSLVPPTEEELSIINGKEG